MGSVKLPCFYQPQWQSLVPRVRPKRKGGVARASIAPANPQMPDWPLWVISNEYKLEQPWSLSK